MKTLRPEIKNKGQLKAAIVKAACANHTWINAFTLIRPTDELYVRVGKIVVDQLKAGLSDKQTLLPSLTDGADSEPVHDISRLSPTLYLSFNAS